VERVRRISGAAAAAALAVGLYVLAVWFDVPGSGPPDDIPSFAAGVPVQATSWWEQIHGIRGWGAYYGPGGTGAYYLHVPAPPLYRMLPLLAVVAAGALLVARSLLRPQAAGWRSVAVLVVLGYLMQLSALWLHADNPSAEVTTRVYGHVYGGYVTAVDRAHASTFFGDYAGLLRTRHGEALCPVHCGTHPPGIVLALWVPVAALRELPAGTTDSVADFLSDDLSAELPPALSAPGRIVTWLSGHLTMLLAASIVVPLFALARRLADPRHALALAALGLATPAMIHFAPVYDQLWALAGAVLVYLALRGLGARERPLRWGLAAGVVLGAATFGSLQLWVLAIPLAAMAVAALRGSLPGAPQPDPIASRRHLARWALAAAAGCAAPWLLAWVGGLDVPAVIDATRENHVASTIGSRPYWPWVVFDLTDYAQLVGLPLVAVAVATTVSRRGGRANLYGLLFVGLVLALDVSGSVRGETGRIWMFVTPLALAAVFLAAGRGRIGARGLAMLLAAQALVTVVIQARWSYLS
jgi:hypothetical protein